MNAATPSPARRRLRARAPASQDTGRPVLAAGWMASLAAVVALVACGGGGGGGGAGAVADSAAGPAPSLAASPAPGAASPLPAAGLPIGAPTPAPAPAPVQASAAWGTPVSSARLFISGHSLTDNPLGDQLVAVANGLGGAGAARYNQQIEIGSPMRARAAGAALDTTNWPGFRIGKNREGSGMDVARELRAPATLGGDRYDTLLIAERHDLLEVLQWENTVRYLRQAHDLMQSASPGARTFFYETWWYISDKANPAAWIAHERAQSSAWQCVATRVNTALAHEGRPARITPLPAGAALADLVERAVQGQVPGVSQPSARATLDQLFSDNVHLTPAGMYYMALVSYGAIYQRSPVGAPAPAGVSATAAASLQQAAWRYVSNFYASYQPASLDSCRTDVAQNFCSVYWNYRGRPDSVAGCRSTFSATQSANPLFFDAAANAGYWFALP